MSEKLYVYHITFVVKQGYAIDVDIGSDERLSPEGAKDIAIEHVLTQKQVYGHLERPQSHADFVGFKFRVTSPERPDK